jgi:hypothetical protein
MNLDAQTLVPDLAALNERLAMTVRTAIGCLSKDGQALEDLRRVCRRVVGGLLIRLSRIRDEEKQARDREILQTSLKRIRLKRDLDTLGRRLSTFKMELKTQIVPFLKYVNKFSVLTCPPRPLSYLIGLQLIIGSAL